MSLILFTIQYNQDLIEQLPIIKQPIFYSKYIPKCFFYVFHFFSFRNPENVILLIFSSIKVDLRSNFKITYTNSTSLYEDQIDDGNFRQVASLYNRIGLQYLFLLLTKDSNNKLNIIKLYLLTKTDC